MEKEDLIVGGVYNLSFQEGLIKIVGLDETEVLYDVLHGDEWFFYANKKKKSIFYRLPRLFFFNECSIVREENFTDEELKFYRPDLPLRLCRFKDGSWGELDTSQLDKLKDLFINCNQIYISPYGTNGGIKKSDLIKEKDNINEYELLLNSAEIQKATGHLNSDGVGLYRLGVEKGLPRYGTGEFYDRAGNIKYAEENR